LNVPMPAGMGDPEYLRIFRDVLVPVGLEYRPELVLVSAGFDAHREDPLGGMELSSAGYAAITETSASPRSCGKASSFWKAGTTAGARGIDRLGARRHERRPARGAG
jgi:acetoin utilization deacetylase AcuC-like enzyme